MKRLITAVVFVLSACGAPTPSAMRVTTMPQPTAVQPTQEAHPGSPPPDDAYPAPPPDDAYPAPGSEHHHEHTPDAPKPGLHCGHC